MRGSLRWLGSWREGGTLACLVAVGAALAACNLLSNPDVPRAPDLVDQVSAVDLRARFPRQTDGDARPADRTRSTSYYGSDAAPVARAQRTPNGEGYELNFENTPVTTVAKVILGDILGLGYTIDPRVQGTITLASGRPVPKSDILFVLESALRLSNVVLVREKAGGYRLVPATEAIGSGALDRAGNPEPGFGITAIPLQYVSAQTLSKLIDSFATKPGSVRVDTGRNLVLIQGTGAERSAAIDIVLNFDADWMRGQSVGIYPVRNSTPDPIITELERIMDAKLSTAVLARARSSSSRSAGSTPSWSSPANRSCCAPRRPGSPGSTAPTHPTPGCGSIGCAMGTLARSPASSMTCSSAVRQGGLTRRPTSSCLAGV